MALLPGLILEPARNLRRQGPETAAQFERPAPTVIKYRVAGTLYTDTLTAGMVAVLWGGSTTTVDMTAANYVTFIEPQLGGAAALRIIAEADWSALWNAQDVVPLDYCWLQGMRYYQPRSIAAIILGNSMTGDAVSGAVLNLYLSSDFSNPLSTALECWFHVTGTAPGSAQDLGTLDASSGGTLRVVNAYMDTDGHLYGSFVYDDADTNPVQTLDLYRGEALSVGWYYLWIATSLETPNNAIGGHNHGYRARVWKHDGTSWSSWIAADTLTHVVHGTYAGYVGLGQNGHSHWPDSTGWNITDLEVTHASLARPTVPTVPTAHPSPVGDALYTMQQPIGVPVSILDISGAGADATPGTAHIVVDSPYPYTPTLEPMIATIAGNGGIPPGGPPSGVVATSFGMDTPTCCCFNSLGDLYFTDRTGSVLYKMDAGTNIVNVWGTFSAATSLVVDATDNLFIADVGVAQVLSIPAGGGSPTVIAGTVPGSNAGDGAAAILAVLDTPEAVAFDAGGVLYIGCQGEVRQVSAGIITAFAGTGIPGNPTGLGGAATSCPIRIISGIAFDVAGNCYFSDYDGWIIYQVAVGTGIITMFAGQYLGGGGYTGEWDGVDMMTGNHAYSVTPPPRPFYVVDQPNLCMNPAGDTLYYYDGYRVIRKMLLTGTTAFVTTVAGYVDPSAAGEGFSGDGGLAYLAQIGNAMATIGFPSSCSIDPTTGNLAFADLANNRIRLVTHP